MIVRKSKVEIEKMRLAGQVVADVHKELRDKIRPGMTTFDLDRMAEERIRKAGATPTFKGYQVGPEVFPATLCVSINEEVVHGIPNRERVLEEGSIISIDCGATLDGYVGDSAITLAIGRVSEELELLMERTRGSLYAAIAQSMPGNRIGDISYAVESFVRPFEYGVVEDYCGHGVGRRLHEEPQIPNIGVPNTGRRLKSGWCLAIEPMINLGTHETILLEDGWTVITADRKASSHFEHSIAVTDDGPIILTSRGDDPPGPWTLGTSPMV
ncbi:MAG: type I methionyl aminopeptidase [Deltaproteobacteria bacterium HGW-Deltaproteobacteria-14]|jgi:methionyl aminopeptidase|nr:MAG: type I methionyl aminopeptidase [Deltaproteobacteria bacterium HGW-Deltaproteobacteria-14]